MARPAKRSRTRKAAPVKVRRTTRARAKAAPAAKIAPVPKVAPPKTLRKPAAALVAKPTPPTPARVEEVIPSTPVGRPGPAVPPATSTAKNGRSAVAYQPPKLDFMDPARALKHAGLKTGMTVADLGAGAGFLSILAARQVGPTGRVYSVDILKDNLRGIRSQAALFGLPNVVTVWADLEVPGGTKIPNDSCDVTLLFKVLCQQQAHEKAMRETVRITKPGGMVLITEWAEARFGFCPPERIVQKQDAIALAGRLGLKLIEEHVIDGFHYMLEFRKKAS